MHATVVLTRQREGRAHIGLDGVHFAGSTHPCSRTHSSNAFPAEEKTALTFCALSNMFRPNTHRAAQEFGQFLTANLTQRRCLDAIGNPRRPIPTQEFGQFFEKRRALQWRRRTRMDSSIHPCSRIWTVLGQERPHRIGRHAGGREHPSLRKNLDSSE